MKCNIEKCAMLKMKGRKKDTTKRKEQLNQERIRTHREEVNYKYLRISEVNPIKP